MTSPSAVSVEPQQWRALVRAYLACAVADRRTLIAASGGVAAGLVPLVAVRQDVATLAHLTVSLAGTVVGLHACSRPSRHVVPDDVLFIAAHPVAGRTYAAARWFVYLLGAVAWATFVTLPTVIAILVATSHPRGIAAALVAAAAACALVLAGTIRIVYRRSILTGAASAAPLAQGVITVGVMAGVFLPWWWWSAAHMAVARAGATQLPPSFAWLPTGWFAAWATLGQQVVDRAPWGAAMLGALSLAAILLAVARHLGAPDGPRVQAHAVADDAIRTLPTMAFLSPERRALLILVAYQWRRLLLDGGVVTVAATFGVACAAALGGWVEQAWLHLALLALPTLAYSTLLGSSQFKSAWVIRASPVRPDRLIAATRDLVALVTVPLVFVAGSLILLTRGGNAAEVARETAVTSAAAFAVLAWYAAIRRRLPLAGPPSDAFGNPWLLMLLSMVASTLTKILHMVAGWRPWGALAALACAGVIAAAAHWRLQSRVTSE